MVINVSFVLRMIVFRLTIFFVDQCIRMAGFNRATASRFVMSAMSVIDDHMLFFFMRLQQCEHMRKFVECRKYSRLKIAYEIWRTSPPNMITALIRANL